MTEEEARAWLETRFGDAAVGRLARFASLVEAEAARQNLIAASTLPLLWSRHLVDSAQLVPLAPAEGLWVDIGTGAGFPGLVVAILRGEPMTLVEPRRLRTAFLRSCVEALGLRHACVVQGRIEQWRGSAVVISARAVAPVEKLLHLAQHCATRSTRWLLPRGQAAADELAPLRQRWSGAFHVEHSIVDPGSVILVLDGVVSR